MCIRASSVLSRMAGDGSIHRSGRSYFPRSNPLAWSVEYSLRDPTGPAAVTFAFGRVRLIQCLAIGGLVAHGGYLEVCLVVPCPISAERPDQRVLL